MKTLEQILDNKFFKGECISITNFRTVLEQRSFILPCLTERTQADFRQFLQEYDGYLAKALGETFTYDVKQFIRKHMKTILAAQTCYFSQNSRSKRARDDEEELRIAKYIKLGREMERKKTRESTVVTFDDCEPAVQDALQALKTTPPDTQRAILKLEDLAGYLRRDGSIG